MNKKRILWCSNFSLAHTGFGKSSKEFLSRLYKTGKYEIAELGAGISTLSPDVTKVPWKVYGAVPQTAEENFKYQQADGNLKRAFDYGLMRFDEAVYDFKPDIVVNFEDLWSHCAWIKQTKYWGRFQYVVFSPLDAEPLSEEFAMFLKDVEHVYTYSDWSVKIAHDAGITQAKYATLGVNTNTFKVLDKSYVQLLRTQNFIKSDDFVVLMVARNQVRKKFDAVFESLNYIQKLAPDVFEKIKFLPYCQYTDIAALNSGMDFTRFWRNRKVDMTKILTPYHCGACGKYHLSNTYHGFVVENGQAIERADCIWCGTKGSCHTPSVISGLTDDQLNEVYNICDVNLLATSNEGFGCSLPEGFAAGKPIITTMYSTSWEMAENSNAGIGINCSLYNEWGTYYKKANVEPEAVAKSIIKYFRLKQEKRVEMSKNAREYVAKNHNYDLLAKQWESIFDNIKPIENVDWDKQPKTKNPNPQAQIPQCANDVEWILALYKHILDADIVEETGGKPLENQGVQYWLREIQNQVRPKDQIEQQFRAIAMQDLQKKPVGLLDLLDPNDVKRMLYVIPQSMGDCFISTSVIASLKENYPEHAIYVASAPQYQDIFKNNPHIKRWLPVDGQMLQYGFGIDGVNKGIFDIVWTPTQMTQANSGPNWSQGGKTKSFLK